MVGGLAANVSTVILVGAALAFMHVAASPQANDSAILIVALVILVVGLALIVVGTFLRGIFGLSSWSLTAMGWLFGLWGVLILVGLAAGVSSAADRSGGAAAGRWLSVFRVPARSRRRLAGRLQAI